MQGGLDYGYPVERKGEKPKQGEKSARGGAGRRAVYHVELDIKASE